MIFRLVIVFCLLGPLFVSAVTNVATVNVQKVLVPHFDGWGVSLCWWANVMGGFTNREEVADLAFTQLGLNIVRYNLGGGENPARSNAMEFRARVPGFQPEPGQWDWNADANQRWMLRAALKRGANHVVAFANSPPDWMTESGSVTGSASGTNDNLREKFEAPFAEYIATIVSNLTVLDGVKFDTVTPMNEPAAHWWKLGNRQEGAHMSVPQQARMVNLLRAALDRHGSDATIVAPLRLAACWRGSSDDGVSHRIITATPVDLVSSAAASSAPCRPATASALVVLRPIMPMTNDLPRGT